MDRSELVHLGWDDEWEHALAAIDPGAEPGRLVRVERGESDVATARGIVRAQSDSQRSQSETAPVTGDWVTLQVDEAATTIDHILPRRNALVRRDPGERGEEQTLSANVDVVFLVHGFDRPISAGKLERFLVLAWNSGATPVVILSKSDLADAASIADFHRVVAAIAPDVQVVTASMEDGSGLAEIRARLAPARTGTLLGESGAGKSTLLNALMGDEVQRVQNVRSGDARGRHTTVSRDLYVLPDGGLLIDTPGLRAIGLWDARDALEQVFADIAATAVDCRFSDCAHGVEPGCAVVEAVEAGEIDPLRLDRYRALRDELAELESRVTERQRRGRH